MDTGSLGAPSSSFRHHPTLLYSELLMAISLCLRLCLCLSLFVSVSVFPSSTLSLSFSLCLCLFLSVSASVFLSLSLSFSLCLCLSPSVSVSLLPPQHSLRLWGAVRWGQASEWPVHPAGSFPKALFPSLLCINL